MDKKQIFIGVGIISVALLVYYHFHNATNTGASQTLVSSATALSPSQQTANAAIPAAGLSTNATGVAFLVSLPASMTGGSTNV